jgi:hypothetical protein
LPGLFLKSLRKLNLHYASVEEIDVSSLSDKTVIYLHGANGFGEDNSILHSRLLQENCNLIRFTYAIDFSLDRIDYPEKADDMLPFLESVNKKILPDLVDEISEVMERLMEEKHALFLEKEIIVIAHSLGAGIAANYILQDKKIKVDKFINLDGTIFEPARSAGLPMEQLHLSQDTNFNQSWLIEDVGSSVEQIGKDYGMRIQELIQHSNSKAIWIQLNDANHMAFTDFPNIVNFSKWLEVYVGKKDTADRIREYIVDYVLGKELQVIENDKKINTP